MSNYNSLKATIDANIKQNGNQEITGQILNSVLNAMVTTLGTGYQFAGVATIATNPGTPDAKVFYIANGKGTYEKFGGLEVTEDDVVVFYWDSSWHKVSTGIASNEKLSELDKKIDALALGAFYGYFPDSASLPKDVTTPGYAYVGLDNPYKIWNFDGKSWTDSSTSIDMNDADEEDITRNAGGKLQLKDRHYGDGMGYVILRKDKTFAEQVTEENTIYEVRYDFEVGGTVDVPFEMPSNCILKFNGGKLKSGVIKAEDTQIDSPKCKIFDNLTFIGGICNQKARIEWFVDIYLHKRDDATSMCAASQIEEAMNSGFRFIVIGRDRYYPIKRTIVYTGDVNIIEDDLYMYRHSQSRDSAVTPPCIYSNNVVTLLDYHFSPLQIRQGLYRTLSLSLRGLELFCSKPYTNLDEKETPILKVTAEKDLWGLEIDAVISSVDRPVVVNNPDSGYYISTATTESAYLPNYTGILLATDGGYMTNVVIKGSISNVFYGIRTSRGANVAEWMTALNLDAPTKCAVGASLGTNFAPLLVTNEHQTIRCFEKNNGLAYFNCSCISNNGFVYDVNLALGGICAAQYALRIVKAIDNWATGNQLSSAKFDEKTELINYKPENCVNLLNSAVLNSAGTPLFAPSKNGELSYQVKSGDDDYIDVWSYTASNKYYDIMNSMSIFGNTMHLGDTVNDYRVTDNAYFKLKTGYENATLNFKLKLKGITDTISSLPLNLFLNFKYNVHENVRLKITDTKSGVVKFDGNINTAKIYDRKYYKFILPMNFDVDITFDVVCNGRTLLLFPIIFIPNEQRNTIHFYKGWSLPTIQNNSSPFLFKWEGIGYSNRLFHNPGASSGIYDADGFKAVRKSGTTAQRPTAEEGFQYYDSTLKKYILWNGSAWVNLDGTSL